MTLAPSTRFDDAFFDSLATSVGPVETARSLPLACYTDQEFYAFEKEAMRPGAMEEPLFDARMAMNMSAAMEITAQDLHVDELVQIGLQSKFAPRGRYSWQEQAQRDLNVWLVERYRRAWARSKGEAPSASSAPPARQTAPEPAVVD